MKKIGIILLFLLSFSIVQVTGATAEEKVYESDFWSDPNVEPYTPVQWLQSNYLNDITFGEASLDYTPVVTTVEELEDQIYLGIQRFETEFVIRYESTYALSKEETMEIIRNAMERDHYNWKSISRYGFGSYGTETGKDITIIMEYLTTKEQEVLVDQKIQEILSEIIKPGMTNLEKVKAVNDFVITNTGYTYDTTASPHSAYAILFEQGGVCQGYALVALRLLEGLGFEALYVEGDANGPHGWNLVKIDGEWYQLDTTWNDPTPDVKGRTVYSYFLISDDIIDDDHTWDKTSYPAATSTKYNKFNEVSEAKTLEDYLIYRNGDTLNKMNIHTLESTFIAAVRPLFILLHGEFIYFSNYMNGGYLTRVKHDGSNLEVLTRERSDNLNIEDNKLYYTTPNGIKFIELEDTTNAVSKVTAQISQLNQNSTKHKILEIEALVNELTDEEKQQVTNLAVLEQYLQAVRAAIAVDAQILALSEWSTDSEIDAVQQNYNQLTNTSYLEHKNHFTIVKMQVRDNKYLAQFVIDAINGLTESTPLQEIQEARELYTELTNVQRSYVVNVYKLQQLEAMHTEAELIGQMISSKIDNLSIQSSLEEVKQARQDYEALTEVQKQYVRNLYKLQQVEDTFINAPTIAESVSSQIEQLNDLSTEQQLQKVRAVYDSLYNYAKSLVSNIEKLERLEQQIFENKIVTQNMVNSIDSLSYMSSYEEIDQVVQLFNTLTEAQQLLVTNGEKLLQIDSDSRVAKNVDQQILALSEVSAHEDIINVFTSYNVLTDTQKQYIKNADILALYKALLEDSAEAVSNMIEALTNQSLEAEITAARAAYDALSEVQQQFVTNIEHLQQVEQLFNKEKQAAIALNNEINTIDASASLQDLLAIQQRYNELTSRQQVFIEGYESFLQRLETKKQQQMLIDAIIAKINAFSNVTNNYVNYLQGIQNKIDQLKLMDETLMQHITNYETYVELDNKVQAAAQVSQQISQLEANNVEGILAARQAYNDLTKDVQKYVESYSLLTNLEKKNNTAIQVVQLIDAIDVKSTGLLAQVNAANAAFKKLTDEQKLTIYNVSIIDQLLPQMNVVELIAALKPTSSNYIKEVENVLNRYNSLADNTYVYNVEVLENANEKVKAASNVVDLITALSEEVLTIEKVEHVRAAYNELPKDEQKYVTNIAQLTTVEKNLKPIIDFSKLVTALPTTNMDDSKYRAQLKKVETAYNKLTDDQKRFITSTTDLLEPLFKQMKIYEQINALKPTSAKYIAEVNAAKEAFEALGEAEARKYVSNADKLTEAVEKIKAASAVVERIAALTAQSSIENLSAARVAYNTLPKDEQKYVANLKDLTTLESKQKDVLAVVNAIAAFTLTDAEKLSKEVKTVKTALSKVEKSGKVTLVYNLSKYNEIAPQMAVYDQIKALKPTSAKYIAEVNAAKEAFEALGEAEARKYVSNADKLTEAVEKIKAASAVVEQIAALTAQSSIENLSAARVAYNTLPKDEQKYVANLKDLTTLESNQKDVLAVVNAIAAFTLTDAEKLSKEVKTVKTALSKVEKSGKVTLVYNLSKYNEIAPQMAVYDQIKALKPTSAKYIAEVNAAKEAFEALGEAEARKYVSNADKLTEAVGKIKAASVLVEDINALPGANSNLENLESIYIARTKYLALPKDEQKYVTNLKHLTTSELKVKNAITTALLFAKLDENDKNYERNLSAAYKSFNNLKEAEQNAVKSIRALNDYFLEQ